MSVISTEIPVSGNRRPRSRPSGRLVLRAYLLAVLAVVAGWAATRDQQLVDPGYGLGYWLGISGASMMAVLLLYPLRKRIRWMRALGATRHWFRMHMCLGVLGPVLILYHCNFSFGSLNSNVALVCTLLVALSGLIGRYLYTHVHTDLDGHRASLVELTRRARMCHEEGSRAAILLPRLLEQMRTLDEVVLSPPESVAATLVLPLRLALRSRWDTIRLSWYASRQLKALAKRSPAVAADRRRLGRTVARFIRNHQRKIRRVAELGSYERLFSLWHVFHLPFFYMLVLTALLHVLAVHMY
jgi:hypothetical protein